MNEQSGTVVGAQDPSAAWRDPPGMGRILVIGSAVGVGLSLVLITVGMLAAGQVWQSSLALGVFVALWGGLGFGSMIGGVVYLTRIESAAKALEAEHAMASRSMATGTSAPPAPAATPEPDADSHSAAA